MLLFLVFLCCGKNVVTLVTCFNDTTTTTTKTTTLNIYVTLTNRELKILMLGQFCILAKFIGVRIIGQMFC